MARYGIQMDDPSAWVTWVSGMTTNPKITPGGSSTTPDSLAVAACFKKPVGTLSAAAAAGDTTLAVSPTGVLTDDLDTDSKKLVRIGESELAWVTSVGSNSISVDTATAAGVQALQYAHAVGAEICRIDVVTFTVETDGTTGIPELKRNDNQGANTQVAAEGISNMKLATTPPRSYRITLTARSERRAPMSNGTGGSAGYLTRTLSTQVTRRN
jgi:hypothetical protein